MIRIFKLLSPALLAVIAISAMAAATASAGSIAADEYPAVLDVEAIEGQPNSMTFAGTTVECNEVIGGLGIEAAESSKLVNGGVGECEAGGNPATVTKGSCEFEAQGLTGSGENWTGTGSLSCPAGVLETHMYNSPAHTTSVCTVTVGSQSGLEGATVTNDTNGGGSSDDTITVEGPVEGVAGQVHGACSFGLTINFSTGVLELNLEVSGKNIAGEAVGVRIE